MRMRVLAVLVPLLALGLAGCLRADEPLAQSVALPTLPDALQFAPPLLLPQAQFGGEPGLAVAPDGTVFAVATSFFQSRPNLVEGAGWLWRSRDGGATWDTLRQPDHDRPGSFCSCDSDVATSADGWAYYTDGWATPRLLPSVDLPVPMRFDGSVANYVVERSSDGGATWQSMPVTTLDAATGVDRQWLLPGANGFLALAYSSQRSTTLPTEPRGNALRMVRSSDHGATWSMPVDVVPVQQGRFHLIGHPRATPQGLMTMPYMDFLYAEDPLKLQVAVALSDDGGQSWRSVPVAEEPRSNLSFWPVQMDVDADGTMVLAWVAVHGANFTLRAAESADGGASWVALDLPIPPGSQLAPWVAARGSGEAAIAWYGTAAGGDPLNMPNGTAWHIMVAHRAARDAAWRVGPARDEPVKTGPMCYQGGSCSKDRELLDFTGVAFAPDGRLFAAFAVSEPSDERQPGADGARGHVAVAALAG